MNNLANNPLIGATSSDLAWDKATQDIQKNQDDLQKIEMVICELLHERRDLQQKM